VLLSCHSPKIQMLKSVLSCAGLQLPLHQASCYGGAPLAAAHQASSTSSAVEHLACTVMPPTKARRRRRRRGPRRAPRSPAQLVEDTVGEILLRLPPDDPASLVRASAVCKTWRRALADPCDTSGVIINKSWSLASNHASLIKK